MQEWLEEHVFRHTRKTPVHPLQKVALASLVLLFGISFVQQAFSPSVLREMDRMLSAVLPSVIVDLTNKERTAEHLGTLKRNPLLDEAARMKGEHMKKNNYFAHDSPEGITPWYWFDAVGYDYLHAGENLAVYFDESEDVVDAWMDSPLHKDNILKGEYTEIGVAVVEGKYDDYSTYYVVQLFGTPPVQSPPAPKREEPAVERQREVETRTVAVAEPENTVLGDTEAQEEVSTKDEEIVQEENLPVTITEPELVPEEEQSTLVERVHMDDKTVYIAEHISTSTVPVGVGGTSDTSKGGLLPASVLQIVYALLLLAVAILSIVSIILAERNRHRVQVVYGVGILVMSVAVSTLQIFNF